MTTIVMVVVEADRETIDLEEKGETGIMDLEMIMEVVEGEVMEVEMTEEEATGKSLDLNSPLVLGFEV